MGRLTRRSAVFFLCLALLAACRAAPAAVPEAATMVAPLTFGLLLPETANPYLASIQEGAEEAAAAARVQLLLNVADGDADRQLVAGRQLLERGVAALIIVPVDGVAITVVVALANESDVPVLTIERRAAAGRVLTHIASDNVAGGSIAGDFLARAISGRGRVVELEGEPGVSATQERSQGFHQALLTFPEVELLASAPANYDRGQARDAFARLLAEHRTIDAVFAHNDVMILGAIEAAQAARRENQIVFVGFDAIDEAVDAIEEGELRATVAQQPLEMGRLAVELAAAYLREGHTPQPDTVVDLSLVTR
jgi:ribose transport system substrate-binding protein